MTREPKLMSGIILITVPSIQCGGYFLLRSLMDRSSGYMNNSLRQNFFRAGHAHAGVIVILSLICQVLADSANLTGGLLRIVRARTPASFEDIYGHTAWREPVSIAQPFPFASPKFTAQGDSIMTSITEQTETAATNATAEAKAASWTTSSAWG